MPGTTLGMVAIINSNVAIMNANQARRSEKLRDCSLYVPTFDSKTATIKEQQQYAECIQLLHPTNFGDNISPLELYLLQGAFILGVVGFLVGAITTYFDPLKWGWWDVFLYGIVGFIFLPFIVGFLLFIIVGLGWIVGLV